MKSVAWMVSDAPLNTFLLCLLLVAPLSIWYRFTCDERDDDALFVFSDRITCFSKLVMAVMCVCIIDGHRTGNHTCTF